eukprot:TRINITY_DN2148_c0_g3_i3.p1 TRINITY_DN2148_c0_g3~~TRINITY_DN2148_c0_g3_i3.p1  ORF type:complete len:529 (+),score=99.55 TRINITY_DN2148_c0_g3_i3:173-1759(+)
MQKSKQFLKLRALDPITNCQEFSAIPQTSNGSRKILVNDLALPNGKADVKEMFRDKLDTLKMKINLRHFNVETFNTPGTKYSLNKKFKDKFTRVPKLALVPSISNNILEIRKEQKLREKLREGLSKADGIIIKKRRNWKRESRVAQLFASNLDIEPPKKLFSQNSKHNSFERKEQIHEELPTEFKHQKLRPMEAPRCESTLFKPSKELQRASRSRQSAISKDQCATQRNTVELELPDDVNYDNLVNFTERLKCNFVSPNAAFEAFKKLGKKQPIQLMRPSVGKTKLANQSLVTKRPANYTRDGATKCVREEVKVINGEKMKNEDQGKCEERDLIKLPAYLKEEKSMKPLGHNNDPIFITKNKGKNKKFAHEVKTSASHFSEPSTPSTQLIARKRGNLQSLRLGINPLVRKRNPNSSRAQNYDSPQEKSTEPKNQSYQPIQYDKLNNENKLSQCKVVTHPSNPVHNTFKGKPKVNYEGHLKLFKPSDKPALKHQHDDSLFLFPNLQCSFGKEFLAFALKDVVYIEDRIP